MQRMDGGCLCGAVQVVANEASSDFGACHCGTCRRWGGGPFLAVDCGVEVHFEGEKHIQVFDSSAWAERGFCGRCGTHLFYRIKESGQTILPVGLFGLQTGFAFDRQVFVDHKPDYYDFANETTKLTEAEIFARFGLGED